MMKEEIMQQINAIEKEVLSLKGKKKKKAVKKYHELLHLCGDECRVGDLIYYTKS